MQRIKLKDLKAAHAKAVEKGWKDITIQIDGKDNTFHTGYLGYAIQCAETHEKVKDEDFVEFKEVKNGIE